MGSIRRFENIGVLTKGGSTTVSLAASVINIGGLQYSTLSALNLSTATVGASGVDATIQSSKLYYVYAVLSNGAVALIGSTSPTAPSGFSQYRSIGYFFSNASSQVGWAGKTAITTQTIITASQTYTVPLGATSLRVRMIAGGAGGAGGGNANTATSGTTGGTTSFGSLLSATGGIGGLTSSVGGSGTITAPAYGYLVNGQSMQFAATGNVATYATAVPTGPSQFGSSGVTSPTGAGSAAPANTGAGGGGGSTTSVASGVDKWSGASGGNGGYIDAIVPGPFSATYAIVIGAGGSPGAAGTNGFVGGAGGSGYMIIDETYT